MFKSAPEALAFAREFGGMLNENAGNIDVCLFPNFLSLPILAHELASQKNVYLGAQNCHQNAEGAYTGETSVEMIKSVGGTHILVGHSERREYFNEGNDLLLAKTRAVLAGGLTAVYCCGEKLEDRKANRHFDLVANQIKEVVCQLEATQLNQVVIAYEPVWAIGTGETASPEQAQEMHSHIRDIVTAHFGNNAGSVSILYGGSVKPANALELFSQADIDGGLVGGASLKPADFSAIVQAMVQSKS